jgi:hypothetical protein
MIDQPTGTEFPMNERQTSEILGNILRDRAKWGSMG